MNKNKILSDSQIYTYVPGTGSAPGVTKVTKGATEYGTYEYGHGEALTGFSAALSKEKDEDELEFYNNVFNWALGALAAVATYAGLKAFSRRRTAAKYRKELKKQAKANPKLSKAEVAKIARAKLHAQDPNFAKLEQEVENLKKQTKSGKFKAPKMKASRLGFKAKGKIGLAALGVGATTVAVSYFNDPLEKLAGLFHEDNKDLNVTKPIGGAEYKIQTTGGYQGGKLQQTKPQQASESDKDALMRMLYAETSWGHRRSDLECAAIIQGAVNRKVARKKNSFEDIVAPETSGWNNASKSYKKNYNLALSMEKSYKTRANRMRRLIDQVLSGQSPVGDMGGALNWLHPYLMDKTNKPHGTKFVSPKGKVSYCFDYSILGMPFGKRRIPPWAIQKGNGPGQLPGGISKTRPVMFGKMVASNGKRNVKGPSLPVVKTPKVSNNIQKKYKLASKSNIKNVAVIGDSIMATNYGAGGRLKKILEKNGINVSNLAVGGRAMQKVGKKQDFIANQWEQVKQQAKTDVLVINGGTNDILGMAWTSKTKKGQESLRIFGDIVSEAASMGMKVLIFPILLPNKGRLSEPGPRRNGKRTRVTLRDDHPRRYTKEQIQQECRLWNNSLKQIANRNQNAFYVSGFEGMLVEPGYKSDNVHPKGPESQKIASRLANIIRGL